MTNTKPARKTPTNPVLTAIAAAHGWETLETRNSDRLDFSEISAASLKAMLEAAFAAGKASR